ncbi:MAG: hypothetical protein Q8868_07260 [Bacteroidota bacterium]|nr:hypothetical protein [Bacteroidota bacterium]
MSVLQILRRYRLLLIMLLFMIFMYSCMDALCPAYTGQAVYNSKELHKFTRM